ncbi:FixH family protein [uncultured Cocleimonas sp.]|uniref:FixH family protein n=1 Tax=uncultured Cocleimonas sp. TaxID=1051587 RepID=UPI002615F47A|nr:FixH family protein [uncultured Cocleimonas sp.]
MSNYNLVVTLGFGSLLAFFLFFVFYKIIRWGGKMSALATAALMLLIYVPLSVTHWVGIDVFAIHFAFFMMIPYGLGIITGVHEERRLIEGEDIKRGMHMAPALIIVFFILLATVDSFIISSATGGLDTGLAKILLPKAASEDVGVNISSQFTGAVSNDLQDEEHQFNVYVEKMKKQRERGWRVSGGWDQSPIVDTETNFNLIVKDRSGNPISDATVTSEFRRASDMSYDKLYTLTETDKENHAGKYSVPVSLPLLGCWEMKILVIKGEGENMAEHEIKGESVVSSIVDGKIVTPECAEGEPDVEQKRLR